MTVQICPEKDAACEEFPLSVRCAECPTRGKTNPQPVQPAFPVATDSIEVTKKWEAFCRTAEYLRCLQWVLDDEVSGALFVAFRAGLNTSPQAAQPVQPAALVVSPEPVAYAIYWGIGKQRLDSVHFERATAEDVAAQIKSYTEVRPLYTQGAPAQPAGAWHKETVIPKELI